MKISDLPAGARARLTGGSDGDWAEGNIQLVDETTCKLVADNLSITITQADLDYEGDNAPTITVLAAV